MARNKLLQAIVVLAGAFCLFRFGIRPPMPNSVLSLYMAITLMARARVRLVERGLLAGVRHPALAPAHEPRPAADAPGPGGRDPAARRLLRLFPGLRPGRGAARAARGAPGAARQHQLPREGDQPPARRHADPEGHQGRTPRTRRSTWRPAPRSTSGTACTATGTSWTGRDTSPPGSIPSRLTSSARTRSPSWPRATCSGGSPRAARVCPRSRRPGTRRCRPGRTA